MAGATVNGERVARDKIPVDIMGARVSPAPTQYSLGLDAPKRIERPMTLATRILYAVHGKGTHHKLALDALGDLAGPDAEAWRTFFFAHAARFVEGSKAPDNEFKDFKNHVLHPRDKFWGGAIGAATKWYDALVVALKAQDWDGVVWSAGVLSHYVTDPLMPFHTGQSDAENAIHRATEWSINRAYDSLRAEGLSRTPHPAVDLAPGAMWLADLMRTGATRSNADYERLMAHYDMSRGVVDPPAGLDPVARRLVGDHLVVAAVTVARVFDRAFIDAGATPPASELLLPAIVATLQIPKAMVLKKIADTVDRRIVEAMYDELMATGRVVANLPADERAVKLSHAAEVLGIAPPVRTVRTTPALVAAPRPSAGDTNDDRTATATPHAKLGLTDDLEAAPSIGPKTAERFAALGITTVAAFLASDPDQIAPGLALRGVDAATLRLWQRQAHLVLAVPELNGTHARLLTGAGFMTATDVATADPVDLCAAVLKFAASGHGQQVLRNIPAPQPDRIAGWIEAARAA